MSVVQVLVYHRCDPGDDICGCGGWRYVRSYPVSTAYIMHPNGALIREVYLEGIIDEGDFDFALHCEDLLNDVAATPE